MTHRRGNVSARRRASEAGLTLIEILVVVTIIALFAALVGPTLFKQADKAKVTSALVQIRNFQAALGQYKLDTGNFPTTEQGLNALRVRPEGVSQWNGPYLQTDVPVDPWGIQYVYKFPGEHGDEPDIMSYGADRQAGGDGINTDIASWKSHQQ
jgi:general secretion pathway protein G